MTPSENASIMVVDDQPANLKLLEDMLKVRGYKVRSFPRGRLALAAAVQNPPDLFLLDINMPEMNGYEVCERLKSDPALSAAPVIFLSALSATEDKVKAFQAGGADYITKPFQLEEVQARIQTRFRLSALQQALRQQNDQLEELVGQQHKRLEVASKRIRSMYDQTLRTLGGALDLRDNETAGHSQRVTRYSLEIGQAMGCSEDELGELALGASLHDIGKIGIPDAFCLNGNLTPAETEIMRRHVTISYDLVSQHLFLSHAAQIVLTHHESYDGSGYPQGLIGKEISWRQDFRRRRHDGRNDIRPAIPGRATLPKRTQRDRALLRIWVWFPRCSPGISWPFGGNLETHSRRIRPGHVLHRIRSCFATN